VAASLTVEQISFSVKSTSVEQVVPDTWHCGWAVQSEQAVSAVAEQAARMYLPVPQVVVQDLQVLVEESRY